MMVNWPSPFLASPTPSKGAYLFTRADDRTVSQLRDVTIENGWSAHAEGSAVVSFGNTKVLCTASFTEGVPRWLKGKYRGWDTTDYSILQRAQGESSVR